MSDSRLRELERRWREKGSVEDEAAWLRARVQAGELEQEKLELASYCGHPASAQISDQRRTVENEELPSGTNGWSFHAPKLATLSPSDAVVRFGVVVGDAVLIAVEGKITEELGGEDCRFDALADMIEALRLWLVQADDAAGRLEEIGEAAFRRLKEDGASFLTYELWRAVTPPLGTPVRVLRAALLLLQREGSPVQDDPLGFVRAALVARFVPYVLGYSDPVLERVEARQRETAGE